MKPKLCLREDDESLAHLKKLSPKAGGRALVTLLGPRSRNMLLFGLSGLVG